MNLASCLPPILAMVFAPLMLGVINRTKAHFAGRQGPSIFQPYYDLNRLLGKGAVYSTTTTWVFRAGPIVGLAAVLLTALLVPFGSCPAPLGFSGDLVLVAYLFGLARLFTVYAALDTGSSFEGMGASREVIFSALAEPAMLLGLAAVVRAVADVGPARTAGASFVSMLSLSQMHEALSPAVWSTAGFSLALVTASLLVVFLAENSRIPIDDPNTHLELTMIHEVMVLDHSGPDFAFILYASCLKLWVLGSLVMELVLPTRISLLPDLAVSFLGMFVLAVIVGTVESTMARLRLVRVPQLLVGATAMSALALALEYSR